MHTMRCDEIARAVGGHIIYGSSDTLVEAVSTDTRRIGSGDLFVPIIGERFDGHSYIGEAFGKGASASLTAKDGDWSPVGTVIRVDDTLSALGALAAHYREKFRIPFVGITGSVGKTSTKDMVAGVLGQQLNVLKTEGNFNNEIGLPLTMFRLDSFHQAGVIEMGMSGFGEISRLTAIVKPSIAMITNIGMSHIEKLGSRQNILKAKLEILDGLDKNGLMVLNGDDHLLLGIKDLTGFRTVYYGMEEGSEYYASNVMSAGENGVHFDITISGTEYNVHIPVPGRHNVYNALAAIAAGIELNIPVKKIIDGISQFKPGEMRLNIINAGGIRIINDAYNASPKSMEAALDVLKDISGSGGRKIAVLGDMLEMGEWASKAHEDVGRYAASRGITRLITVGEYGRKIADGAFKEGMSSASISSFKSNSETITYLREFLENGDVVLVKGSRGMEMEQIADALVSDTKAE